MERWEFSGSTFSRLYYLGLWIIGSLSKKADNVSTSSLPCFYADNHHGKNAMVRSPSKRHERRDTIYSCIVHDRLKAFSRHQNQPHPPRHYHCLSASLPLAL